MWYDALLIRDDHEPCRFCGGRNLDTVGFDAWWAPEGWHVVCNDCGACGPGAEDEDAAWELWDHAAGDDGGAR